MNTVDSAIQILHAKFANAPNNRKRDPPSGYIKPFATDATTSVAHETPYRRCFSGSSFLAKLCSHSDRPRQRMAPRRVTKGCSYSSAFNTLTAPSRMTLSILQTQLSLATDRRAGKRYISHTSIRPAWATRTISMISLSHLYPTVLQMEGIILPRLWQITSALIFCIAHRSNVSTSSSLFLLEC